MFLGQFIDEARRQGGIPGAVNAAVGSEADFTAALGAGDPDIGQAAFFFQPGQAAFIHGALMGEQAFFPSRQEDGLKFQTFSSMQRHDRDHGADRVGFDLHHQADMFQEGGQVVEFLHARQHFLEVFQLASGFRLFRLLPEIGIAAFFQHGFGQFHMVNAFGQAAPAVEHVHRGEQLAAGSRLQFVGFHHALGGNGQRQALRPGGLVQRLQCGFADAARGLVDDPLKGQIIGGLVDHPQIGDGVADLFALIEPGAADNAIGNAQGDEAFFEFAGLEASADQDSDFVQRLVLQLQRFDLIGDQAGFLVPIPQAAHAHLVAIIAVGPQGLAQSPLVLLNQARSRAENMGGGAIVPFQPHDLRAGKVLFKTQDVANLCPAPAIDRLIIIANTTDILAFAFLAALGQQAQPEILRDVGILILIDQDILEQMAIALQHFGVLGKDRQIVQQQIAKVTGIQGTKPLLILAIDFHRAAIGNVAGL